MIVSDKQIETFTAAAAELAMLKHSSAPTDDERRELADCGVVLRRIVSRERDRRESLELVRQAAIDEGQTNDS